MQKALRKFLLSAAAFSFSVSYSQSLQPTVIASDGGYYTSSSGSLSWTLGEMISETYSSSANILTQGFQQPMSTKVGVWNIQPVSGAVFIYPNPTRGNVFFDMAKMPAGDYSIELYDGIGKKLFSGTAPGGSSLPYLISFADYATGIYFVNITSAGFRQSYKIINNQ